MTETKRSKKGIRTHIGTAEVVTTFYCKKHNTRVDPSTIKAYFGFRGYCPKCKRTVPCRRVQRRERRNEMKE